MFESAVVILLFAIVQLLLDGWHKFNEILHAVISSAKCSKKASN